MSEPIREPWMERGCLPAAAETEDPLDPDLDVPVVDRVRQQRDHEAWRHAACLTLATTDEPLPDDHSEAMAAVVRLREERDRLRQPVWFEDHGGRARAGGKLFRVFDPVGKRVLWDVAVECVVTDGKSDWYAIPSCTYHAVTETGSLEEAQREALAVWRAQQAEREARNAADLAMKGHVE